MVVRNWLVGLKNRFRWFTQKRSEYAPRPRRAVQHSSVPAMIELLEPRRVMSAVAAVDDSYTIQQQSQMMAAPPTVLDVLANDTSTGGAMSIASVTSPMSGSVSIQHPLPGSFGEDTLLFTPSFGFTGTESFTYTVSDTAGDESSATVTLTVVPPSSSSGDGMGSGFGSGSSSGSGMGSAYGSGSSSGSGMGSAYGSGSSSGSGMGSTYGSGSMSGFGSSMPTAPTVTSIMNNSGSTSGGTSVMIYGTGFSQASEVLFGDMMAASFTVNSDSSITALTPAHAQGAVNVTVVTSAGASPTSLSAQFNYQASQNAPVVSNVTPGTDSLTGGATITITGSGFNNVTGVSFGGMMAVGFTVVSPTTITAVAPSHSAGQVDIQVTTDAGTSAVTPNDKLIYNPAPSISMLSTTTGSSTGGTSLTITGSGFSQASQVLFGTTPAMSFMVNSDSSITVTTPQHSQGTVDILVVTPSGTSLPTLSDQFSYQAPAGVPTVNNVSPGTQTMSGGDTITITGTGFTNVMGVSFGGTAATSYTVVSPTTIMAVAPPHSSGQIDVQVTTSVGTSQTSGADRLYYTTPVFTPVVNGLMTSVGSTAGGTSVTILGTNFTNVSSVWFGNQQATSFIVNSSTSITAITPAEMPGSVDVTVLNSAGTSAMTTADQFQFQSPAPTVSSLSVGNGSTNGGTSMTINGSNLSGVTNVYFGTVAATNFMVMGNSIYAVAPAQAQGTVDVTVVSPSGTSSTSSADQFSYQAPAVVPTVTAISKVSEPTTGGDTITITGTGFTNVTGVSFGGMSATMFNVISSTQITAVAPQHIVGTADIQVTNSAGTSMTTPADQITYQSSSNQSQGTDNSNSDLTTPPTITGLSATTGTARGGTSVTITGTNFTNVTQVLFGSQSAASFVINSPTSITAVTNATSSGTVDVRVLGGEGTSDLCSADQFTFQAQAPTVASVSPGTELVAGGDMIVVVGTGFENVTSVTLGGTAVDQFSLLSSTKLVFVAPPESAGSVDVQVTTALGTSTATPADQLNFVTSVAAPVAPVVTSLSTSQGDANASTSVTINGSGFQNAKAVEFGQIAAISFTVSDSGTIVAVAPPQAAGTVDVTVVGAGQESHTSTADEFTYEQTAAPTITGVTAVNSAGMVRITGTNFNGATQVMFGNTSAQFTVDSPTSILALAPTGVTNAVDVTVTTAAGTSAASAADLWSRSSVNALPTVTSVSAPDQNGTVTVTGTNFAGLKSVTFGGAAGTFTYISPTTITAQAPTGTVGNAEVIVATAAGSSAATLASEAIFTQPAGEGDTGTGNGNGSSGNTAMMSPGSADPAGNSTTLTPLPGAADYVVPKNLAYGFEGKAPSTTDYFLGGSTFVNGVPSLPAMGVYTLHPVQTTTMSDTYYNSSLSDYGTIRYTMDSQSLTPEGWAETDVNTSVTTFKYSEQIISSPGYQFHHDHLTAETKTTDVRRVQAGDGTGYITSTYITTDTDWNRGGAYGEFSQTDEVKVLSKTSTDAFGLIAAGSSETEVLSGQSLDFSESSYSDEPIAYNNYDFDARVGNLADSGYGFDTLQIITNNATANDTEYGKTVGHDSWSGKCYGTHNYLDRNPEDIYYNQYGGYGVSSGAQAHYGFDVATPITVSPDLDGTTTVADTATTKDKGQSSYYGHVNEVYYAAQNLLGEMSKGSLLTDHTKSSQMDTLFTGDVGTVDAAYGQTSGPLVVEHDGFNDSDTHTTMSGEDTYGCNGYSIASVPIVYAAYGKMFESQMYGDAHSTSAWNQSLDQFGTSDKILDKVTTTSPFGGVKIETINDTPSDNGKASSYGTSLEYGMNVSRKDNLYGLRQSDNNSSSTTMLATDKEKATDNSKIVTTMDGLFGTGDQVDSTETLTIGDVSTLTAKETDPTVTRYGDISMAQFDDQTSTDTKTDDVSDTEDIEDKLVSTETKPAMSPNGATLTTKINDDDTDHVLSGNDVMDTDIKNENTMATVPPLKEDYGTSDTYNQSDNFTSNDSWSRGIVLAVVGGTETYGNSYGIVSKGNDYGYGKDWTDEQMPLSGWPTGRSSNNDHFNESDGGTETDAAYFHLNTVDPSYGLVTKIDLSNNGTDKFTDYLNNYLNDNTYFPAAAVSSFEVYGDDAGGGGTDNYDDTETEQIYIRGSVAPGIAVDVSLNADLEDDGQDHADDTLDSSTRASDTETDLFGSDDTVTETGGGHDDLTLTSGTGNGNYLSPALIPASMAGNFTSSREELDQNITIDDGLTNEDAGEEDLGVSPITTTDNEHDTDTVNLHTNDEDKVEDKLDSISVKTLENGTVVTDQVHNDDTDDIVDKETDGETDKYTENVLQKSLNDDATFNDGDVVTDTFTSGDGTSEDIVTPEVGGTLSYGSSDSVTDTGSSTEKDGAIGEDNTADYADNTETDTSNITSGDGGTEITKDYMNLSTIDPTTGFVTTISGSDTNNDGFTDSFGDQFSDSYGPVTIPCTTSQSGTLIVNAMTAYSDVETLGETDSFADTGGFSDSMYGSPSAGVTIDYVQTLGNTDVGGDTTNDTITSNTPQSDTEIDKFSSFNGDMVGGGGHANVTWTSSSDDGAGDTSRMIEKDLATNTIDENLSNLDGGTETIEVAGGAEASDVEQDTFNDNNTAKSSEGDLATIIGAISETDPSTGLTTIYGTNQTSKDQETGLDIESETDLHTGGMSNTDVVSGTNVVTGKDIYSDKQLTTFQFIGTTSQGTTENLLDTTTVQDDETDNVEDDVTLNADGSNSDTSKGSSTIDEQTSDTKTGAMSSVDPTTGLNTTTTMSNTIGFGDHHTEVDGDTTTTTLYGVTTDTPTSTATDVYTVSAKINETITLTNADGSLGTPITLAANVSDTRTGKDGQFTDQGVVDNTQLRSLVNANDAPGNNTPPAAQPNGFSSFLTQFAIDSATGGPLFRSFVLGMAKGTVIDGAWGTITGIASAPSMLWNAAGQVWNGVGSSVAWAWNNPYQAVTGVLAATPIGKAMTLYDIVQNPAPYITAMTPSTWSALWNGQYDSLNGQIDPQFLLAARIAIPVVKQVMTDVQAQIQAQLNQDFNEPAVQSKVAYQLGVISGMVLYEVLEALALNAADGAIKAGKLPGLAKRIESLTGFKLAPKTMAAFETMMNQVQVICKSQCFAAGTPVLTPEGDRPIESLKVGDVVLARSENNSHAPIVPRTIDRTFTLMSPIFEVQIGGQVIRTTREHPFYVDGLGWQKAEELQPGQTVLGHDNQKTLVEKVNETTDVSVVYNMSVTDDHTFFVGRAEWGFSVWVHNMCKIVPVKTANGTVFQVVDGDKVIATFANKAQLDALIAKNTVTIQQVEEAVAAAAKMDVPNGGSLKAKAGDLEAAARKAREFDPKPNNPAAPNKVRFIDDTPNMGQAARNYEDAATGARSNVATQRRQVPVLDRTLPDGTKAPVKFDGIDGNVLIDRKTSITTFPKSKDQALRQSQALRENGFTGRWEVPNQSEANRALKMLQDLGITNIEVKVVP